MLRQAVRRPSALRMQTRGSAWNFQNLIENRIPDFKGRPAPGPAGHPHALAPHPSSVVQRGGPQVASLL